MGLYRLAFQFKLAGEAVECRKRPGARCEQGEQPGQRFGVYARSPGSFELSAEDPLDIGTEVAATLSVGAFEGIGESPPDDPGGMCGPSLRLSAELGRVRGEDAVDECIPMSFDLALGKRPKVHVFMAVQVGKRLAYNSE